MSPNGHGDGGGGEISAANIDWAAVGAVGEEVDDREREADSPQFGTDKSLVVNDERDFVAERQRLR